MFWDINEIIYIVVNYFVTQFCIFTAPGSSSAPSLGYYLCGVSV